MILESLMLPLFGEVKDILVFNVNTCLFVIKKYITECFLHHYHAYEVLEDTTYCVDRPMNFVDYHPLSLYTLSNGKKVISLKYHVIEFLS